MLVFIVLEYFNISVQSNLIKRQHHRRTMFNRICQVVPMCTPSNICILGVIRVHIPKDISIGSAVFAQLMAVSLDILYNGPPFSLRIARLYGGCGSHLIHGSLGPAKSTTQMACQSVKPFCTAHNCDTQTDHATQVGNSRQHLHT